jgi:RHS repeat-associated protein
LVFILPKRTETDHITQATLQDGIETITVNFNYSKLEVDWYGEIKPYSLFTPGPETVISNSNNQYYYYEQRELVGLALNPPVNNKFSLISSIKVNGPSLYTRSFTYDDACNLISETGPDGIKTYTYQTIDSGDLYFTGVTSVTHGILTTGYVYDDRGRLVSVTQGDAAPTTYSYDSNGNVSQITDSNGNSTTISYDSVYGLFPVGVTSGERTWTAEYYYPFGWLKSQTIGPYTTSYTYDAIGRLLNMTDSAGTVTTTYDDEALRVETVDYEGNKSRTTYDAIGRRMLNEIIDKLGATLSKASYVYDPQYDFRVATISTNSGTRTYTYDDSANSVTVTDMDGNSVTTLYDPLGRKTQVISSFTGDSGSPGIETTTYTYDGGLLAQVTDSARTILYNYNSRGLATSIVYSDGKQESFSYDGNGNPLIVTGRDGRTYSYGYNAYNEVETVKLGTETLINITYDNLGRIETLANKDVSYRNYYNMKGLPEHSERTIKGRLYDLWYEYGAYQRLNKLTVKDGQGNQLTQFGYDYAYPKTTVSAWVNGSLREFASGTVGANGLMSAKTLGNGLVQNYGYDTRRRLKNTSIAGLGWSHNYSYGPGNNIVSIDNESFQYDNFSRLKSITSGLNNLAYQYDQAGNRIRATVNGAVTDYTYTNGLLTGAGGVSFTYYPDGSRKTKTGGNGHWDYSYDNLGRLTQVKLNDSQVMGSYGYDPTGWRVWKEENGKTHLYIRDNEQVIYQEIFDGNIEPGEAPEKSKAFVYFGSELVGTVINGTEVRYYINNHLGTTEIVTDAAGQVISKIQHAPFGDRVRIDTNKVSVKLISIADHIDPTNTTAVTTDGQAIPAIAVRDANILIYNANHPVSIFDPHFNTVKEYVYSHTDPNILQLKVVTTLKSFGSGEPVEKVEFFDLADKPLGQYAIKLDIRKDVGTSFATENEKFEVYISKVRGYVQSRLQTTPIPVETGTNSFSIKPYGNALTKVTWAYSTDNGLTWNSIIPEQNEQFTNDPSAVTIRATLNPGDFGEVPVVTGFEISFNTVSGNNIEDFFFTGKELDATGLYYFGARYYDPEVGLFISEDPSQDGLNWYEYCRANPLKYVDPDGRAVIIPVVIYMYITALMASPDLQMDIQLLCYDLSAGDYTSAAADIIGLALPGLPASVTSAPKRWLSGWLAKHGDELVKILKDPDLLSSVVKSVKKPIQGHHWINQAIKNHPFVQLAKSQGIDITKDSWNLSKIPHIGGHTKEYYQYVRTVLDEAYKAYIRNGTAPAQIKDYLQGVVGEIIEAILSGKINLYRN